MTNQQIAEFLESTKVQIQLAIDEKFRPVYKSNTWLKQKDLTVTERVVMQLIDERADLFSNKWLCEQTGFSSKCIRENLAKLMERGLVKKVGNTHNYKAISIV